MEDKTSITGRLQPSEINVVIYHANCPDGFGSAFAVWHGFGETDEILYCPAQYGMVPPDVSGKNVLICDFSYPLDILQQMILTANKLLIIDHHKTSQKDLETLSDKYKIFDMNHSGAYLVWKYMFPSIEVPNLILYIEDRDLWRKQLPYTEEFTAGLSNIAKTFENFEKLLKPIEFAELIGMGRTILAYDNKQMDNIIRNGICRPTLIAGKIYNVAYLNSVVYRSDLGNRLLSVFPECDFSCIYVYGDSTCETWISLRSSDDKTDVSEIAKLYGGGGHRNASGITLKGLVNSTDLFSVSTPVQTTVLTPVSALVQTTVSAPVQTFVLAPIPAITTTSVSTISN